MVYVYLFEAKGIQSYLFRSGKLKDVVAASERLDRLVDDHSNSVLTQVLDTAGLKHDLFESEHGSEDVIHFTRCKGGAFYSYAATREPLLRLRQLWTLTLQQLFPSLEFADALCAGENLGKAMEQGHPLLSASRNAPSIKFPIATAICDHYPRTGLAAVPLSAQAKRAVHNDDVADLYLDLDTEHHRQAYQWLELRHEKLLEKFTGNDNQNFSQVTFPLDFEEFPYAGDVKDIALIHVDGNGLGILLRGLQDALKNQSDRDMGKAFRCFSTSLAKATQQAASQATEWLYQRCREEQMPEDRSKPLILPMRPLVLGGDDITLFCRADLALEYASIFCRKFKQYSEQELVPLFRDYLSENRHLKRYLTASGGVLYHKSGHPFITCHHLVEGLCKEAKQLTKRVDANVGPAALSFYRLSNALAENIESLREQSQTFAFAEGELCTSLGGYLVEEETTQPLPNLPALDKLAKALSSKKFSAVSIAKWRQLATLVAQNDFEEARRVYLRATDNIADQHKSAWNALLAETFGFLSGGPLPWIGTAGANPEPMRSFLADLLIADHFMPQTLNSQEHTACNR